MNALRKMGELSAANIAHISVWNSQYLPTCWERVHIKVPNTMSECYRNVVSSVDQAGALQINSTSLPSGSST